MLMRLERDRFSTKAETLQKQLSQAQFENKDDTAGDAGFAKQQKTSHHSSTEAPWPIEDRVNPYLNASFETCPAHEMKRSAQFKGGHNGPISRAVWHPKLPVVATV